MDAVGIVAEYDPLHPGHLRHLALTRERCPGAAVVVCMSGNWVQRGTCAVSDKWTRARWAVEGGADLVLELPTVFAMASAEFFARGAVSILTAAGCGALSFGCEDPDPEALGTVAAALDTPDFHRALRPLLEAGHSYPAARREAVQTLVGPRARVLDKPNNNLAVEYLRALPDGMAAIPILRTGAHHGGLDPNAPAASAVRAVLRGGDIEAASPYLARPWSGPVFDLKYAQRAVLGRLRAMSPEELEALPDGGDGAGRRLWKAAREAGDLEALYAAAKTRRLTEARLRRLTAWAFLGLSAADRPPAPRYLRVLAMSARGAHVLARIRKTSPLPVITKPARAKAPLAVEARCTDLFALCAPDPLPCGGEFRHTPFVG